VKNKKNLTLTLNLENLLEHLTLERELNSITDSSCRQLNKTI